jgi:hypothetical protein
MNDEYLKTILSALSEPMQYKWRVQSFSRSKPQATCVAYIDARDAMSRLDAVCVYGWHRRHTEVKGRIYCEVGIVMPDSSVLWRSDCGTESNTEAEKGESSDSFKRACVNFGIGRFLYDLDMVYLPADAKKEGGNYPSVVDDYGKKVWDLTKHINAMKGKPLSNSNQPPKVMPSNLTIGDAEFGELNRLLDETGSDKAAFCQYFGVNSVAAMPMNKYASAVSMLQKKVKK